MRHHIVRRKQTFLGEENDSPVESRAALEEVFTESSYAQTCMKMGMAEAIAQGLERGGDMLPFGIAQFGHALTKARVEVNPHNLPVKVLLCPEARALRTSALTPR